MVPGWLTGDDPAEPLTPGVADPARGTGNRRGALVQDRWPDSMAAETQWPLGLVLDGELGGQLTDVLRRGRPRRHRSGTGEARSRRQGGTHPPDSIRSPKSVRGGPGV